MKHPKRPMDSNKLAKHVVDIATGEIDESIDNKGKKKLNSAIKRAKRRRIAKQRIKYKR
jgi:hypothetical protein